MNIIEGLRSVLIDEHLMVRRELDYLLFHHLIHVLNCVGLYLIIRLDCHMMCHMICLSFIALFNQHFAFSKSYFG